MLAEVAIPQRAPDQPAQRSTDTAEDIAKEALGRELTLLLLCLLCLLRLLCLLCLLQIRGGQRIHIERQEALSKLPRKSADLLPEILVPERAPDKPAQRSTDTAQEIAEEALRRELTLLLLCLLRLLCLLQIRRGQRIHIERQEALSELSRKSADLLPEVLVPQRAPDQPAQRRADAAQKIAEEALRCELTLLLLCLLRHLCLLCLLQVRGGQRIHIERQETLSELSCKTTELLSKILVPKRASNQSAQRRADAAHEIAKKALRRQLSLLLLCLLRQLCLLRLLQVSGSYGIRVEWQETSPDSAHRGSDLFAQILVMEQAADTAAN